MRVPRLSRFAVALAVVVGLGAGGVVRQLGSDDHGSSLRTTGGPTQVSPTAACALLDSRRPSSTDRAALQRYRAWLLDVSAAVGRPVAGPFRELAVAVDRFERSATARHDLVGLMALDVAEARAARACARLA